MDAKKGVPGGANPRKLVFFAHSCAFVQTSVTSEMIEHDMVVTTGMSFYFYDTLILL